LSDEANDPGDISSGGDQSNLMSFAGRVVLVTGAGRGIGRAIALAFADRGAAIAIHYYQSSESALSVAEEARARGARVELIGGDLADPAVPAAVVGEAVARFGRIDVLVNNAGVYITTPLDRVTLEQWDRTLAINLRAPFLLSQAAAPHLRHSPGAAIVNVASDGGLSPRPGFAVSAPYVSSKAGLVMLTRLLALELAPEIRVNAVAPGVIASKTGPMPQKARERFVPLTPLHEVGTPADVAAAVVYLASDAARFVTGQILSVDGGLVVR
jgi:NAD(P)-dependent dehydrogenase (short-subunit alcohol dehydrogenase family)